ncbi:MULTISPECIES: hypothetical protein [Chryseobacterium]|uniref:hypothetical protein n=1 Tax=Chryseobacterium TaxID=59732 RepID=UPI001EF85CD8|nr:MULTISPECIES: hypothetical protein [Chryseobacterium]MBM7420918.1 hypothetical protein [Chryseobacterium sp. JUb44]MDH6210875.1 hypothetical protein [Chryseobacterium sp. BIGb0186]WSO09545.1 hypothetical protein VUJ64_17135 [Chryseobacterium scophthalmum]
MHKIYQHFQFRFNQSFRIFNFNPKVSLPVILVFGALMIVKFPQTVFYPLLYFSMVLVFHINRKDIPFLKKTFISNWRLIIFLESAFIYMLFLMANINYKIEKFGLLAFVAIFSLCFLQPKSKPFPTLQWNFISNDLFEWKSYMRKNTWMFILTYIIVVASAYHQASLILCGIFLLDYLSHVYENNENKEMLEVYFKKINFKDKIYKNVVFFNALLSPTYIGFLIFNFNESLYFLYELLFFINSHPKIQALSSSRKSQLLQHRSVYRVFCIQHNHYSCVDYDSFKYKRSTAKHQQICWKLKIYRSVLKIKMFFRI